MGVQRKIGDVIERALNAGCAIALTGRNDDADRRLRDWTITAGVAAMRKIRDAIALGVGRVDQFALRAGADDGIFFGRSGGKGEAPRSKHQDPEKLQAPNSNSLR